MTRHAASRACAHRSQACAHRSNSEKTNRFHAWNIPSQHNVKASLAPSRRIARLFPAIMNRSIGLLFLDVCRVVILLLVCSVLGWRSFRPIVISLSTHPVRNFLSALGGFLGRTASLSDASRENFLAFGGRLAGRRGGGAFVVGKKGSRSRRVLSVMVVEEKEL